MSQRIALTCLAGSVLLVSGYFVLAAPDFVFAADRLRYVALAVAFALPHLGCLALLVSGRRSAGLALAAGTGGVAATMLGPVIVVLVLFAGFASDQRERQAIGLAAVFGLVQLVLAVSAWRAHRLLPDTEKRPGAWGVGVAAPLAYGLAVATAIRWVAYDERAGERADDAAHRALHEIVRCAWAFSDADPGRGFPPDLGALGPDGMGCLDPRTARGELAGHRLRYVPGVADAEGRVTLFDLCAQGLRRPRGGGNTYGMDETGLLRLAQPLGFDDAPPDCASAWGSGARRAKHCLLGAGDAIAGYPRDATGLAAGFAPCMEAHGIEAANGAIAFEAQGDRFSYRPAPPDRKGVVRGFTLSGSSGEESWLLDEMGRIHVAAGRDATPDDPTEVERQERDCRDHGNAQACQDAGRAFEGDFGVRPDAARAAALYQLGCDAGLARGCLSAATIYAWDRAIGGDWDRVARLQRRACDLGDAQGCAAVWDTAAARPGR